MAEGWIKLHRKILDWEWWDDPVMVKVWLQLLIDANYEDRVWRGVPIARGQLVYGRHKFSERCGVSEKRVRTCLERLEKGQQVVIKRASARANSFSIVTIVQYDLYQSDDEKWANVRSENGPTDSLEKGHERATPKEVKKKRIKKGICHTSWDHPEAVAHGPYVRLLPSEFDAMVSELGETRTSDLILRLNGYIEQIGEPAARKRYKSHKATMMNWHRADVEKGIYRKKEVPNDGYAQWT